jgi:hypothetical protein
MAATIDELVTSYIGMALFALSSGAYATVADELIAALQALPIVDDDGQPIRFLTIDESRRTMRYAKAGS